MLGVISVIASVIAKLVVFATIATRRTKSVLFVMRLVIAYILVLHVITHAIRTYVLNVMVLTIDILGRKEKGSG